MVKNISVRQPGISVVVATYNRAQYLEQFVHALLTQSYPLTAYEIIVVNDGSSDGTARILAQLKKRHDIHGILKIINKKNGGPATARNQGIRKAKFGIIAFTDDDCVPKRDWLSRIASYYLAAPAIVGVGGIMYTPKEWIRPLSHHALPLPDAQKNALKFRFPPTSNVSYRKSALYAAGLFDEDFEKPTVEDVELYIRMCKSGKVIFDRKLAMPHISSSSTVAKEIRRFRNFYNGFEFIARHYPREFKQIYCADDTNSKFREIALSIPSLRKLFYYQWRDILNPITFIKLAWFFIITRSYVFWRRFI